MRPLISTAVTFCIITAAYILALLLFRKDNLPRYVRHEKREGWTMYRAIYRYRCPECRRITESSNQGRPDKLRLNCTHCGNTSRHGYSRQIRPDLARLPKGWR